MSAKTNVGFIGLGNIGKPIARHLITESFQLYVYDVFPEAAEELVEQGAVASISPAELSKECQYIGVCVRDDNDVESLLYGDEGLLNSCQQGTIIAIHSTVTQAGLLKWAADGIEKKITVIDAPISGGARGAEAGTLCYMVGGDEETLKLCAPMFETSADKVVHAGDLGCGIALKLCNNLITYAEFTAMSEASRLAEASGLSTDLLREVGLSNGVINEQMHLMVSGRNAMMKSCSPEDMDKYFGSFGRLGRKDLECAIETAENLGVSLPATELVKEMIEDVFIGKA